MISVGQAKWFANPTVTLDGDRYILVTASWDYTEDGETEESRLCFAFHPDDKKSWERGLWQAIGAVNMCRALQGGLEVEDDAVVFSPVHTVH